jgi:hypothetical protein
MGVSYPYADPNRGRQPWLTSPGGGDGETLLAESLSVPERFGELYARYFAQIYRYLAGRLGPDTADDLAAEPGKCPADRPASLASPDSVRPHS